MEGTNIRIENVTANGSNVGHFQTINQENPLKSLRRSPNALFNAYYDQDEEEWRRGTRKEILETLYEWVGADGPPHIFWLQGWAGSGKSTIAKEVSRRYYDEGKTWLASFFFRKNDVESVQNFVGTITAQLAENRTGLKDEMNKLVKAYTAEIEQVLEDQRSIQDRMLIDQWDALIAGPVSRLQPPGWMQLLLVIDALDECSNPNDIPKFLRILGKVGDLGKINVRILITSRPEEPIRNTLPQTSVMGYRTEKLHEQLSENVTRDMRLFMQNRISMSGMGSSEHMQLDQKLDRLVEKASGLFIWISTAARQILMKKTQEARERELDRLLDSKSTKSISELYTNVLQQFLNPTEDSDDDDDQDVDCKKLRYILGSMVTIRNGLSALSLQQLLGEELLGKSKVEDMLSQLHSIVDVRRNLFVASIPRHVRILYDPDDEEDHITRWGAPMRLHHPSFNDYILDKTRCRDGRFHVDRGEAHRYLADCCLRLMSDNLKQDICDLKHPGSDVIDFSISRAGEGLSPAILYASTNWYYHLTSSDHVFSDDVQKDKMHAFLKEHLLHWLEVLGWMRRIDEGIRILTDLETRTDIKACPNLHAFLYDARRFVWFGRSIMEVAPLQIYCSLLTFAPTQSCVRREFQNCVPSWMAKSGKNKKSWISLMHTMEFNRRITAFTFFDDKLATMTNRCPVSNIAVWDVDTAKLLQSIQIDELNCEYLAFSPSGSQIGIINLLGRLTLLDLNTKTQVPTPTVFSENSWEILCSSNSQWLGLCRDSTTFCVWDLENIERLIHFDLTDQLRRPNVVEIDYAMTVRDDIIAVAVNVRFCIRQPEVRSHLILFQRTSSDPKITEILLPTKRLADFYIPPRGNVIIVALGSKIIIYDCETGARVSEFDFSEIDGAYRPYILRLGPRIEQDCVSLVLNGQGGTKTFPFNFISGMKYIHPNQYRRETNIGENYSRKAAQITRNVIRSLHFSSDGLRLASRPKSNSIQLWNLNLELDEPVHPIAGSNPRIIISQNGKFATTYDNETMIIWDIREGTEVIQFFCRRASLWGFAMDEKFVVEYMSMDRDWKRRIMVIHIHTRHIEDLAKSDVTPNVYKDILKSIKSETPKTIVSLTTQITVQRGRYASGLKWSYDNHKGRINVGLAPRHSFHMSFSNDGYILYTNRGIWQAGFGSLENPTRRKPSFKPRLGFEKGWITFCGKGILWLPHEYRDGARTSWTEVNVDIVVLTGTEGISFLTFDFSKLGTFDSDSSES
ncbi:WD40 repeat-like protein [Periconia macrospinosa]|uniref:WD40 repeat-like protein n=1 Tax=Periconia macrospinosa TaxID=97972 RepID=A0A2V1E9F4_9PLEO|nr:WD40 repeat-like protein [Periconia macrospinosa]